jgi:Family of unknown function (DUF6304)
VGDTNYFYLSRPIRVPVVYTDAAGVTNTFIENDGGTLTMNLRNTFFEGDTFDAFIAKTAPEQLGHFAFMHSAMVGYELRSEWPVRLLMQGDSIETKLDLFLKIGFPELGQGGRLNAYAFFLGLTYADKVYTTGKDSGDFETELLGLEAKMPAGLSFHACISCAFSDYSPYGSSLFGSLACFRDTKEEYRQVRGKDILVLWPRMAGWVQETYLCGEFERRVPGTGYRG